jgi:hypothetical protein
MPVVLQGRYFDGGPVQIPLILAELERLGYEGFYLIEYQGENDPRPALQYNIEYLRRQLAPEPS